MRAGTCPSHPGIRIDRHPCYHCQPPEIMRPVMESISQMGREVDALTIPEEEAMGYPEATQNQVTTVTMTAPNGETTGPVSLDRFRDAVDTIAADRPPVQPTLSDTLFPPVRRADVPMVKVSISGTIELTQEQYQSYLDGGTLGPGAVVDVRALGYVVQPGAAWVKRTEGSGEDRQTWHEREGRIQIKLVDLGALAATGEEWAS